MTLILDPEDQSRTFSGVECASDCMAARVIGSSPAKEGTNRDRLGNQSEPKRRREAIKKVQDAALQGQQFYACVWGKLSVALSCGTSA